MAKCRNPIFARAYVDEAAKFCLAELHRQKCMTCRELFLKQMEQAVPWSRFEAIIEPHYPKPGKRDGQPIGLTVMLRIYLMQQWFNLSDPMMKDTLYEIESMRRCAGQKLCEDWLPDESTICKFRRLLEEA